MLLQDGYLITPGIVAVVVRHVHAVMRPINKIYIYISGQDRYRVLIPYRSSSILLTDKILYQSFNQFPRRQRNTCLARDTAVHLNTCVCDHSCAAPGRVPDYPRDRCFCRPALRRHPVAHLRDIRIFPVNSVNREIIPNISNRLHR